GGGGVLDQHAGAGVAGEDDPGPDEVAGAGGDVDADLVGHGQGAGGVGADEAALDGVVRRGDEHAIAGVAGDDVVLRGVAAGAGPGEARVTPVGDRRAAGVVGADVIAPDQGAGGAVEERDAAGAVAGDQVARPGGRAADHVADRLDADAVAAVGDGGGAVLVGADEVAADAGVAGAEQEHAVVGVAGDDVAPGRGRAADARGRAADHHVQARHLDPVVVGQGGDSVDGDADLVAQDGGPIDSQQQDPRSLAVAGDDVAGRVGGAADGHAP